MQPLIFIPPDEKPSLHTQNESFNLPLRSGTQRRHVSHRFKLAARCRRLVVRIRRPLHFSQFFTSSLNVHVGLLLLLEGTLLYYIFQRFKVVQINRHWHSNIYKTLRRTIYCFLKETPQTTLYNDPHTLTVLQNKNSREKPRARWAAVQAGKTVSLFAAPQRRYGRSTKPFLTFIEQHTLRFQLYGDTHF